MTQKHITIIGGGPAGLIAAEILAEKGHSVTIYDRMPSVGRKLLMAGRGGLNLTHSEPLESFLPKYGAAAEWLAPCIRAFPPEALRAWCEGLGEATFIGSSGRVFPRSMKASPLLRAWLKRLDGLGVKFMPRHNWLGWEGEALKFTDAAGAPVLVQSDITILALGGASWPRLGSNGLWADILAAQGVEIIPLRPANCGFIVPWSAHFSERFAGQPLKPICISHNGVRQQGEAMITVQGLEGGVVYALSGAIREAIAAQGSAQVALDVRPGITHSALAQKLAAPRKGQSLSTFLRKAGLSPLAIGLLREVTSAEQLGQMNADALAEQIKSLPLTLTATAGMARAISTAGGIARASVDENFMLRAKPNVYVVGEMLDWDAPTGGYLLQACFSMGVAVGRSISESVFNRIPNGFDQIRPAQ